MNTTSFSKAPLRLDRAHVSIVYATEEILRLELDSVHQNSGSAVAEALEAMPPDRWPPELVEQSDIARYQGMARAHADQPGWGLWYILERGGEPRPRLVGVVALEGPPDESGTTQIGYSVIAPAQCRGIATTAVIALLEFAFRHPRLGAVVAETFEDLRPSIRVLEKAGFQRVAGAQTPGAIRFLKERPR